MAVAATLAVAPEAEASHFRGVDMWATIDGNGVVTVTARTRWRKDFTGTFGIDPSRFGEASFTCTLNGSTSTFTPATGFQIIRLSDHATVFSATSSTFPYAATHPVVNTAPAQYTEVTQTFVLPLGTVAGTGELVTPLHLAQGQYEISWNDWSRVNGILNLDPTSLCGGNNSGFGGRVHVNFDGTASGTPSLTSTFLTQVPRGYDYAQNINAASPQGLPLAYKLAALNPFIPDFGPVSQIPGLTLDTSTGLVSIPAASTATLGDNTLSTSPGADYLLRVEVTDSHGGLSVRDGVLDALTSSNHPPILDPIGDQTVTVGQALTFNAHATDGDSGQTLTVKATGLPTGATFATTSGPNTGVTVPFTWTPTPDQVGVICTNFEATDNGTAAAGNLDTLTAQQRVCFTVVPAVKAVCTSTTLVADPTTCGVSAACSCENGTLDSQPTFTGAGTFAFSCTCSDGTNSDTCSGTLLVLDQTAPAISCPGSVTSECTANGSATLFAGASTATDACGAATVSDPPTAAYPLGTTTVSHTAQDPSGNVASCTNTVTVVDTTAPSITCPGALSAECTANQAAAVTPSSASGSDACTAVTISGPAAGSYPLGTTSVTYTAHDTSGNATSCSSTISVVDTTAPTLACPSPIVTECTGAKSAGVVPGAALASDACSSPTITGPAAGSYPLGTTPVSYTARDVSGNATSCSSSISVVDTTAPSLACPAPITAECTGNEAANVTPGSALGSDVCSNVTITGPAAGSYPLGTTTVAYTASDESLNATACSSSISVVDTTAPSITCPDAIVAECTGNGAANVTPGIATASDTCSPVNVTGPAAGSYPLGSTLVNYSASDTSGNASSCSAAINVVDTTAPVIAVPSGTATQYVVGSCGSGALSVPVVPTAVDGCQGPLAVTCTTVAGTSYGANTVTCTATDASGNSSSVALTLVVMQPLTVVFDPPLVGGGTVENRFTAGQTLVNKVRLLDCSKNDVTTTAPVTVRIDVTLEQSSGGVTTEIADVPETFNGVGDSGSRLVLVSGDYQYNLSTTGYQTGTQYNAKFYQSKISVSYDSAPALVAGSEVAHLESK